MSTPLPLTDDLDANGIGRYRETTPIGAKFSAFLNRALDSISAVLTDLLTPPTLLVLAVTGTAGPGTQHTATTAGNTIFNRWATPVRNRGFGTWTGGEVTIAKAGTYRVSGFLATGSTTAQVLLFRNSFVIMAATTGDHGSASMDVYLTVGERVSLGFWSSASLAAVPSVVGRGSFSVVRVSS